MVLAAQNSLRFSLPTFEGPLDLLLHLIRKNQIDIYDIPIASITEQYMEYLERWEALDLSVAGEFLVMAATLLEIKSRMLLPQPPPAEGDDIEPEDPRAELVQKLLEYQRFQGAVETLQSWEGFRRNLYFRGAIENPDDYLLPVSEGALDARQLFDALRRVLLAAGLEEQKVTAVVPRRRVSLRMKMAEVLRRTHANPDGVGFADMFELPCYRYDIVLVFLAVLELLRQGLVRAEQKTNDDPIVLFSGAQAA